MDKKNILNLGLRELEEMLVVWEEKPFRAKQVFAWIYKKDVTSFAQMSDLSQGLRHLLEENFSFFDLGLSEKIESSDGTKKFLFQLKDKNLIEAVIIPAERRVTGCISSQVGCKFGCNFCASGILGFKRNLDCAEIIQEALLLNNHKKITHLVFMGTGEPLDNYDNVLKAIRIINSKDAFNIGTRRITISTAGVVPGIERLSQEGLQIELSVSLHAAEDKIRDRLMPVNKKYPLSALIKSCKDYIVQTNRQITFEYCLIKGLNSDLQNAAKLVTILKGLRLAKVNLIPANPIKELKIEPPAKTEVLLFKDYLQKQGIPVTLRRPRGEDIEAACGQLRLKIINSNIKHQISK